MACHEKANTHSDDEIKSASNESLLARLRGHQAVVVDIWWSSHSDAPHASLISASASSSVSIPEPGSVSVIKSEVGGVPEKAALSSATIIYLEEISIMEAPQSSEHVQHEKQQVFP